MAKEVNAGPRSYRCTSSGRTGQKSLRNQNRRKKRMLTAEVPRTKMSDSKLPNKQTALQTQTGGTHYKNMAIQPAEYAEKNGLSLLEGNVVKYITRWKLKGQPLSDLEKAKHCIDLLIEIHNVK
jgi:hypothetical protein